MGKYSSFAKQLDIESNMRILTEDARSGLFISPYALRRRHPKISRHPKSIGHRRRRRIALARFRSLAWICVAVGQTQDRTPRGVLKRMFEQGSTGVDKLINTYSNRRRFSLWLSVYATLVAAMVYMIINVFSRYLQYGCSSAIDMREPLTLEFPAVTICNLNILKQSSFCFESEVASLERRRLCSLNSTQLDRPRAFQLLTRGISKATKEANRTGFNRNSIMNMMRKHSFYWNETLISCFIARNDCYRPQIITHRFTSNPEYGLCFTLFGEQSRRIASINDLVMIEDSDNPDDGLHLVLDVHTDEYLPFLIETGFVVIIHRNGDDPDVTEDAVIVPAGRTSHIQISKSVSYLQKPPYESNCHDSSEWPPDIVKLHPAVANQIKDKDYSKVGCEYICRAISLDYACDCADADFLDFALLCELEPAKRTCKRQFSASPSHKMRTVKKPVQECKCPNRCRQVKYKRSVTYSAFTGAPDLINGSVDQWLQDRQLRHRFAEIYIYFAMLLEDEVRLSPTYTWTSVTNEIGGFLGCFVGMAFMNLYEIAENFVIAATYGTIQNKLGSRVFFT